MPKNCLFVTISQSGETADTLAALQLAKEQGYMASLSICNVPGSSMVRESDMALMTRAGAEIGVASTKAFTTQLSALLMLAAAIGRHSGMSEAQEAEIVQRHLRELPNQIKETLKLSDEIESLAEDFCSQTSQFVPGAGHSVPNCHGRGIKAERNLLHPRGSLRRGRIEAWPLALIDGDMPVIVVAPNNDLLEKLKSNMEEVRARGGQLYVFADRNAKLLESDGVKVLPVDEVPEIVAPILYTIPLQLLSYYVAIIKGTDVDQPRNLAKSVTVE